MNPLTLCLDMISLIVKEEQASSTSDATTIMLRDILEIQEKKRSTWSNAGGGLVSLLLTYVSDLLDLRDTGEKISVSKISNFLLSELLTNNEIGLEDQDGSLKDVISDITRHYSNMDELYDDLAMIKRNIYTTFKKDKLKAITSQVSLTLSRKAKSITNVDKYIEETIQKLEVLTLNSGVVDEAIIADVDLFGDNVEDIVTTLEEEIVEKTVFKTGWQDMNRALQGGIRTGEFTSVGALSENYKTGMSLSLWASIPFYNKPRPTKDKPLALWISFEDDIVNILGPIYSILKITETGVDPDMSKVILKDIIKYIKKNLEKNGWNIKIMRVNPTQWTYKDIFNTVNTMINKGFDVQLLVTDYLDKLPSTGLVTTGPHGSDKRELVKRVRNFIAPKDIAYINPWQLSAAANELLKSGLSDKDFLTYVHARSYYQGNSTLKNELDTELFTHKVKALDGRYWLAVHRGKHKLPTIIKDEYKKFYLPFPSTGYIPFDTDKINKISVPDPDRVETQISF